MANQDTVFGARVTGNLYSSHFNGRVRPYVVPATDAVALFVGDFVTVTGDSAPGHDGKYHPVVGQSVAGVSEFLTGVVVGFNPDPDNLNRIYRPASTLRTVYVADDPYVIFEIQASGTLVTDDIGLNANLTVGAGSVATGLSGMEIDLSTKGAEATKQIRILDLSPREDNEFGANAKVIAKINLHTLRSLAGI